MLQEMLKLKIISALI